MSFNDKLKFTASSVALVSAALTTNEAVAENLNIPLDENGDINITSEYDYLTGKTIIRQGTDSSGNQVADEGNININGVETTLENDSSIQIAPEVKGNINITNGSQIVLTDSSIENNNISSTTGTNYDINISGANTKVILNENSSIITGADENDIKNMQTNNPDLFSQLTIPCPDEEDCIIDPTTNINITDGAFVQLNGNSDIKLRSASGGDIIIDDATIEVTGKTKNSEGNIEISGKNTIFGSTVLNNQANLIVADGADLTISDVESKEEVNLQVNNSFVKLAGKLTADIQFDENSELIYNGSNGRLIGSADGLKNLTFEDVVKGNTSEILSGNEFVNLEDVSFTGEDVDITIDNSSPFKGTGENGEEEGIIAGNINVEDGATLTVFTDFADNETFVERGASLNIGHDDYDNEFDTYTLSATENSSINLKNEKVDGKSGQVDEGGEGLILSDSNLTTTNSYVDMIASNLTDAIVTANSSTINGDKTNITDSEITLSDNSKIGSAKRIVRADEDGYVSDPIADMLTYGEYGIVEFKNNFDVNISSSNITLNDSSLENTIYAATNKNDFGLGEKLDISRLNSLKGMTNAGSEGDETWQMNLGFVEDIKGTINIQDATTVTMNGSSSIINNLLNVEDSSGDIIITGEGTKVIAQGNNVISATGGVIVEDSAILEVGQGGNLTVSSCNTDDFDLGDHLSRELDENGNNIIKEVQYDLELRGPSKLILAGAINGNINLSDLSGDSEVIMTSASAHINGIIENMDNLTIKGDINAKTSEMMQDNDFSDVKNFVISGANTNLIIDSDPFYVTEEHKTFEKHLIDDGKVLTSHNIGGADDCEEGDNCHLYTNQIGGDLTVKDGANVTIEKEFAAHNFNIDDATLSSTALLNGTINVTNGGSFNFDGSEGASIMLIDKVNVEGKTDETGKVIKQGTAIFDKLARADIGQLDVTNSKLTIKDGWYQTGPNNLMDMSDYNSFLEEYADKPFNFNATISDSKVELDNAKVKLWQTDITGSNVVADGNSHLSGDRITITDSILTASGNTKIGSLKTPIVRAGDGEWQISDNRNNDFGNIVHDYFDDYLADENGEQQNADVVISNSTINLNDNSSLENTQYTQNYTDEERPDLTFTLDKVIDKEAISEMRDNDNIDGGKWNIYWDGWDEGQEITKGNVEGCTTNQGNCDYLKYGWDKNLDALEAQEGQIIIEDGSVITMSGTSQIANNMINTEGESGDVIVSGENTKIIAKGENNKIIATGGIEFVDGASLEVADGGKLTAVAKGEEETFDVWFENSTIKVGGTLNTSMSMINSTVDISGGNITSDADITLSATDVTVTGTSNISAEGNIDFNDASTLEVVKGATLTAESQNPLAINNSTVKVGGTLNADLDFFGDSNLTLTSNQAKLNGNKSNLSELGINGGEIYNSSSLGNFSDLNNLTIDGLDTQLVVDSDTFKNTDEGSQQWYRIEDGYTKHVFEYDKPYEDNREYLDGDTGAFWEFYENEDSTREYGDLFKPYDNQILRALNINNGAVLDVNKTFAASSINISNNAKLNINELMYGNFNINTGASVTINGSMIDRMNVPTFVADNATLSINSLDELAIGVAENPDAIPEEDISEVMTLTNSSLTADSSFVSIHKDNMENNQTKLQANIIDSTVSLSDSALSGEILNITSGNITAKDSVITGNSLLHIESQDENIENRTQISLNNSKLGSVKRALKYLGEDDGYESGTMFADSSNVEITDSDIVLKGNSSIESSFYVTSWDEPDYKHRFGKLTTLITDDDINEIVEDAGEYYGESFAETAEQINEHSSLIEITNSNITMEETSSIANNNILTGNDSGDITFETSEVTVKGTNKISATGNIEFSEGSILEVVKDATLMAEGNIDFNNASILEVVKGATLTAESQNPLAINNSTVKVGGTLNADLDFSGDSSLTLTSNQAKLNGNKSNLTNLTISGGEKYNLSLLGKFEALTDLNIDEQNTQLTIDTSTFNVAEENQQWYRIEDNQSKHVFEYDKPYEDNREYLPDGSGSYWEIEYDDGKKEYDDLFKPYDNQILGALNINNGAILNVNKTFAASSINVSNNAKLNINELMYGNFNINTGASATINGKKIDRMNVPTLTVADATLAVNNLNELAIGVAEDSSDYVEDDISEVLTITGGTLSLNDSFVSVHKDNIETDNPTSLSANITDSNINMTASAISAEQLNITSGNITAKDSVITANETLNIKKQGEGERSQITLNNSKLGSMKMVLKYKGDGEYEPGTIFKDVSDVDINNSDIVLKGNSSIESSFYINSWDDDDYKTRFGKQITLITDENVDRLMNGDDVYSMYDADYIRNHESTITITDSDITMEGSSSISNNNLTQGDIIIDSSYITTKGKNKISATGDITLQNASTLDILKGSTLTAISGNSETNGYDIAVNNGSTIKVGGTLDGKAKFDETSSLVLADGGKIASEEISGLKEFGIDGSAKVQASKTIQTVFNDLEDFNVTGSKDAKGNVIAPKFTLNAQIFKTEGTQDGHNEIKGNLTVSDGASIDIQTDFTADNINIENGATLTTNKQLNTHLNAKGEKSKATIDGGKNKNNYDVSMKGVKASDKAKVSYKNANEIIITKPMAYALGDDVSESDIIADNGDLEFNNINNLFTSTAVATNGGKIDFTNIKNMSGTIEANNQSILNFNKVNRLSGSDMIVDNSQLKASASNLSEIGTLTVANSQVDLSKNTTLGGMDEVNITGSSEVVLNDTSKLVSDYGDINLTTDSVINAKGKSNVVSANNINIDDATLDVASGAVLNLEGSTNLTDATIKLSGTLNTDDISFDENSKLVYTGAKGKLSGNADISSLSKLGIEGNIKTTSSTMFKNQSFDNLSEFTVVGTLDAKGKMQKPTFTLNSAMFSGWIDDAQWFYDPEEKEYIHGDYLSEYYTTQPYANQIAGDFTVENANVTINKELAAENINVNNGANLTTNALIYSNLNVVGEGAKATINGQSRGIVLNEVNVTEGGTLTFNAMEDLATNGIYVDGGTLNYTKWGEDYSTQEISIYNGALNAQGWEIANGISINVNNSNLTLKDALMSTTALNIGNEALEYNYNTISLSKNSMLNGVETTDISSANITLNDSAKIGSLKESLSKDIKGGINGIADGYLDTDTNVYIDDSDITLNGSSSIENSFVIWQDTKSGNNKITGYLTKDTLTDEAIENAKIEEEYISNDDLISLRDFVDTVYGTINITDSDITMNGTSQIANRLLTNGADLIIGDASTITVKGKNKLVAGGEVGIYNSTLDVAKGSTLTVESYIADEEASKDLRFEDATLKLSGTLNANVTGSINTLILGKSGNVNGNVDLDEYGTPVNFGISGVSSEKDIKTLFGKYQTEWNGVGGNRFYITDKSKVTFTENLYNDLDFQDVWVDNGSTLTTKTGDNLNMNGGGIFVENMSTLNISNGTNLTADGIHTHASNVNINGSALKKGQTEYQTKINVSNFAIGNIDNPKAKVNIKNAELNVENLTEIVNTTSTNLTNVDVNSDLLIASFSVAKDKKGKDAYNTSTLTNVKVDGEISTQNNKLVINNSVEADRLVTSVSVYEDIEENKTYIDFKGNNVNIAETDLQGEATLAVASGKTFDSDFSVGEEASIILKGNLSGNISGAGTIDVQNAKSKINAAIDGVKLAFGKIKANMSAIFGNSSFSNLGGMKLNSSTITADRDDMGNVGNLVMDKATLTLKNDLQTANADINASKLYLGTNTLDVDGMVEIAGKSSIYLNVDNADTYGKIKADTINLSDKTTSMAVTLKKGVDLRDNNDFKFLDYTNVNGELGKVTIANNRYKFTEVNVGQFTAEQTSTGKGVIERFDASKQNLAVAAMYLVDDETAVTSTSETLNTLSQIVGGEGAYASSLATVNADDTGLALNSSNEISQTVTNAALSQMTSGNNTAIQGMSSGDEISGGSVWTKVLYNHSELDASSKYDGFTGNTTGMAFGGDKMATDDIKAGVGYAYTQSRIKNDIRTTDVDTHTLMLYGEYKPSQWFANGVFSFGWSDYSQKASNGIVSVSSDFDVYATALLLNTGYEAKISKSTTVTPYVGMRYLNVVQDDYIDSDNKQISTDNSDLLTFTAATKVKTDFNIDEDTTITPEVRFGLTYDVLSDSGNSIVSLSNGASYEVKTRRLDRLGVEIGAGVSAFVNDNWEITAGYEGKFKQDYQDHTGTFDIKYNF